MKNRKIELRIILLYFILMLVSTGASNYIFSATDSKLAQLLVLTVGQVIATIGANKVMTKHYRWRDVGFGQINKKSIPWLSPYIVIISMMLITLISNIVNNFANINITMWIMLVLNLIGTVYAGFSEEVIFRGIILNNLRKETSIIIAMIISSIGFSIMHITTVFSGLTIIEAVYRVLYTSLLGFSFVALAIKLNNIWPLIVFHVLWNFILVASPIINAEVSRYSLLFNPINLVLGITLWIAIIVSEFKRKKISSRLFS